MKSVISHQFRMLRHYGCSLTSRHMSIPDVFGNAYHGECSGLNSSEPQRWTGVEVLPDGGIRWVDGAFHYDLGGDKVWGVEIFLW